jgi:hypothetical protein
MSSARPVDAVIAVHEGLRHEFARLPITVKAVGEGDVARAGVVGRHVLLMVDFLNAHHDAEEIVLRPWVAIHLPNDEAAMDAMHDEHDVLTRDAAALRVVAEAWMASPGHQERASLHTALIAFERLLLRHLATEEQGVLAEAAQSMEDADVTAMGVEARRHLTIDQAVLQIGLILDDATPDHRAAFIAELPPAVWADYEEHGRAAYSAYKAELTNY